MTKTAEFIGEALRPPTRQSLADWSERNVRLDHTSYVQGRLSLEFYPHLRAFLGHAQRRRMKRLTAVTAAQSAKTTAAMLTLLWRIAENPTPTMWISASTEKAKEFAKRRLYPFILDCPAVDRLAPLDRREWSARLVQFATMDLMIRGAVSKQDMTSDPVGLLVCDERREWRPGMIELARKRITTFGNAQELSIGTAGIKDDSLHRDWLAGSQGFFHWDCPKCGHSQPFRFGRKATPWFPEARERGGVVWPDDERTRLDSSTWNIEGVRSLARYECERCFALFGELERMHLIKHAREVHRRPQVMAELPSLTWSIMLMPLSSLGFGALAAEFLQAKAALKTTGDVEPLKTFVCDSLGEPWEMQASRVEASDIMARVGNYSVGERWENKPDVVDVLTMDRQKDYLVYVWRQWMKGGASRLVQFGKLPDNFEEVRKFQLEHGIKFVAGDDGGYEEDDNKNVMRWRVACMKHGWFSFKGDKKENFAAEGVRVYWKRSPFNTGAGNYVLSDAFLWCKEHYLNKLYNVFLKGEGPAWGVPRGVQSEYLNHLRAYEYHPGADGKPGEWVKSGADHAASCELMQLVFADAASIVSPLSSTD